MHQSKQWPSGNAADWRSFGRRFEPRSGEFSAAAGAKSQLTRTRTTDRKRYVGCVTIGPRLCDERRATPLHVAF